MTEDDGEIDLKYDERYSRARRNSLAVSALLVVVSLARFDGPVPLPIIGASAYIPQKLAIFLLTIPTVFFFVGYWRAYKRTLERNLEYIADASNGAPSAAIDRFLTELEAYRLRLKKLIELNNVFDKTIEQFEKNYPEDDNDRGIRSDPLLDHPRSRALILTGSDKENVQIALDIAIRKNRALMQREAQVDFVRTKMKKASSTFSNNSAIVNAELILISENIGQIFEKMMKLSSQIRSSDMKWFNFFDHLPTIITFGISLVLAGYTFSKLAFGVSLPNLGIFNIFY
ncbi:hypothetical protein [Microcystis phage Mae-JY04]|uniref:hypothetical protein n=1 Tax=Blastomonas sp. TaxID=1909299 RepID=UPI00258684D5|nr:hypothetical protein [Blastomonas sp.]